MMVTTNNLNPIMNQDDMEKAGWDSDLNIILSQNDFGSRNLVEANDANKNKNQTVRPDPHIPQVVVSPWLQSTITPDPYQRDLC